MSVDFTVRGLQIWGEPSALHSTTEPPRCCFALQWSLRGTERTGRVSCTTGGSQQQRVGGTQLNHSTVGQRKPPVTPSSASPHLALTTVSVAASVAGTERRLVVPVCGRRRPAGIVAPLGFYRMLTRFNSSRPADTAHWPSRI